MAVLSAAPLAEVSQPRRCRRPDRETTPLAAGADPACCSERLADLTRREVAEAAPPVPLAKIRRWIDDEAQRWAEAETERLSAAAAVP